MLAGCATKRAVTTPRGADLDLSLQRASEGNRTVMVVTFQNRSDRAGCIRAEAIRNPYSSEIGFEVLDLSGLPLPVADPGYIPEPLPGSIRLEPAMIVEGRYYLGARFERIRRRPLPAGWKVRASVHYGYCEDTGSLLGVSDGTGSSVSNPHLPSTEADLLGQMG